jgi:hypothetical protein
MKPPASPSPPPPDYELVELAPDGQRAQIRFRGPFEGREVIWDATVLRLAGEGRSQFIEVGEATSPQGRALTVGLRVAVIDEPTLRKTVVMIRGYKRLRRGRHEFLPGARRRRAAAAAELPVEKIVSGGQTGVDRAALDAARALGLACGGWCPRGRRAEDGAIPLHYPLTETATRDYRERTRRNVEDADGTLILGCGPLGGGTAYTRDYAEAIGKPYYLIRLDKHPDVQAVQDWIRRLGLRVLNVAGPRESQRPGAYRAAKRFLLRVLAPARRRRVSPR